MTADPIGCVQKLVGAAPLPNNFVIGGGKVAKGDAEMESWFSSLGLTSTLKPTVLNEFRIGFRYARSSPARCQ